MIAPLPLGIGLALAATAFFGIFDNVTKYAITHGAPLVVALWFRYMFQAVTTTLAIVPGRGLAVMRTKAPTLQCLRGLVLVSMSLFTMFSLQFMPVGEFTAIVLMAPLLVTLFVVIRFRERVSTVRWLLLIGAFAGTLVVIRPGAQSFNWATLLPVSLVFGNAWFQVLTSQLSRIDDPITTHFYTGWLGAIAASILLPFAWETVAHWSTWLILVFMGCCSSLGHFLLIVAYKQAPAATLTPYLYCQILFSTIAAWLIFDHVPDSLSLLGMALILSLIHI